MAAENKFVISQFCTFLQSTSRDKQLIGLHNIDRRISELEQSNEQISKLWDFVSKYLLQLLNSNYEKCRIKTLEIINTFIKKTPTEDKYIIYLLPTLSKRLGSSSRIETSEDIYLKCIILLKVIITKYGILVTLNVDDLKCILTRSLEDVYPTVRKESLNCVSELAKNLSKRFNSVSESFIKPVLINLTHKHSNIREAAVLAIGDCIYHGNSRFIEEVANPLAQRLSDENFNVREAVVRVASDWLLHLPDRYSWWHKILPLLLTALHDDVPTVSELAAEHWDRVGRSYLKENNEDEKLKSKLDFLSEPRHHYPANVTRPNLGCRVIAQQTFGKLINGICLELGDWQVNVRLQAAKLLSVFVLNVEEEATQHIAKLLPAMYRACKHEDMEVVRNVERAAEYIGYFVPPETYSPLIIATFEEGLTDRHLVVFSKILNFSERSTLSPMLTTIAQFLQKPSVCQSNETDYQQQMLSCCHALISVCNEDCRLISEELFRIIFTVLAMTQADHVELQAELLLNILTEINSFANLEEFYNAHVGQLLLSFDDCKSWSDDTAEAKIFSACLVHVKGILDRQADLLLPILKETTSANANPRLRLQQFTLLSRYFDERLSKKSMDPRHVNRFLLDCIIPNLIWSAGKTAEAIRVAVVACLQNFLLNCNTNDQHDCSYLLIDQIIPLLTSLADDTSKMARFHSLNALRYLLRVMKRYEVLSNERVYDMCPVLLKRLDDGSKEVREASLATLTDAWKAIPDNSTLNTGHVDFLYTTLLIYLDDFEANFQASISDSLKELAVLHPELLYEKLEKCRSNFKNQESLDILTKHCQQILKNT